MNNTELDLAILDAYTTPGNTEKANRVYQIMLRSFLYIPVGANDPEQESDPEEPYKPLIAKQDDRYFLVAFDSRTRLQEWAGPQYQEINSVELTGRDLVNNLGAEVYLALNPGSAAYKEFSPEEIARLKVVVAKTSPRKK